MYIHVRHSVANSVKQHSRKSYDFSNARSSTLQGESRVASNAFGVDRRAADVCNMHRVDTGIGVYVNTAAE